MKEQARSVIWWPFTQHSNLSPSEISVIDSRCGDHWSIYADGGGSGGKGEGMRQVNHVDKPNYSLQNILNS
jgi:hypothetical protein